MRALSTLRALAMLLVTMVWPLAAVGESMDEQEGLAIILAADRADVLAELNALEADVRQSETFLAQNGDQLDKLVVGAEVSGEACSDVSWKLDYLHRVEAHVNATRNATRLADMLDRAAMPAVADLGGVSRLQAYAYKQLRVMTGGPLIHALVLIVANHSPPFLVAGSTAQVVMIQFLTMMSVLIFLSGPLGLFGYWNGSDEPKTALFKEPLSARELLEMMKDMQERLEEKYDMEDVQDKKPAFPDCDTNGCAAADGACYGVARPWVPGASAGPGCQPLWSELEWWETEHLSDDVLLYTPECYDKCHRADLSFETADEAIRDKPPLDGEATKHINGSDCSCKCFSACGASTGLLASAFSTAGPSKKCFQAQPGQIALSRTLHSDYVVMEKVLSKLLFYDVFRYSNELLRIAVVVEDQPDDADSGLLKSKIVEEAVVETLVESINTVKEGGNLIEQAEKIHITWDKTKCFKGMVGRLLRLLNVEVTADKIADKCKPVMEVADDGPLTYQHVVICRALVGAVQNVIEAQLPLVTLEEHTFLGAAKDKKILCRTPKSSSDKGGVDMPPWADGQLMPNPALPVESAKWQRSMVDSDAYIERKQLGRDMMRMMKQITEEATQLEMPYNLAKGSLRTVDRSNFVGLFGKGELRDEMGYYYDEDTDRRPGGEWKEGRDLASQALRDEEVTKTVTADSEKTHALTKFLDEVVCSELLSSGLCTGGLAGTCIKQLGCSEGLVLIAFSNSFGKETQAVQRTADEVARKLLKQDDGDKKIREAAGLLHPGETCPEGLRPLAEFVVTMRSAIIMEAYTTSLALGFKAAMRGFTLVHQIPPEIQLPDDLVRPADFDYASKLGDDSTQLGSVPQTLAARLQLMSKGDFKMLNGLLKPEREWLGVALKRMQGTDSAGGNGISSASAERGETAVALYTPSDIKVPMDKGELFSACGDIEALTTAQRDFFAKGTYCVLVQPTTELDETLLHWERAGSSTPRRKICVPKPSTKYGKLKEYEIPQTDTIKGLHKLDWYFTVLTGKTLSKEGAAGPVPSCPKDKFEYGCYGYSEKHTWFTGSVKEHVNDIREHLQGEGMANTKATYDKFVAEDCTVDAAGTADTACDAVDLTPADAATTCEATDATNGGKKCIYTAPLADKGRYDHTVGKLKTIFKSAEQDDAEQTEAHPVRRAERRHYGDNPCKVRSVAVMYHGKGDQSTTGMRWKITHNDNKPIETVPEQPLADKQFKAGTTRYGCCLEKGKTYKVKCTKPKSETGVWLEINGKTYCAGEDAGEGGEPKEESLEVHGSGEQNDALYSPWKGACDDMLVDQIKEGQSDSQASSKSSGTIRLEGSTVTGQSAWDGLARSACDAMAKATADPDLEEEFGAGAHRRCGGGLPLWDAEAKRCTGCPRGLATGVQTAWDGHACVCGEGRAAGAAGGERVITPVWDAVAADCVCPARRSARLNYVIPLKVATDGQCVCPDDAGAGSASPRVVWDADLRACLCEHVNTDVNAPVWDSASGRCRCHEDDLLLEFRDGQCQCKVEDGVQLEFAGPDGCVPPE